MSLTLNMVGGGGGGLSATDALLRVQAPAGSTVTISKGGTTKTDQGHENAEDTSLYDYYFIIHQSQFDSTTPWTVTATLGADSASDTVIIGSNKEYYLELSYTLWIIKDGIAKVETILCGTTVLQDPDYYILSSTANVGGKGASWLIDSAANYTTITFVFSKNKSTILSGNDDRCGLGTGLVDGGAIATQNATYLAYSAILPLTNDLETRVIPIDNLQTQGNYAQVSVKTGSAAGSRVIAIKDIYLSR